MIINKEKTNEYWEVTLRHWDGNEWAADYAGEEFAELGTVEWEAGLGWIHVLEEVEFEDLQEYANFANASGEYNMEFVKII